MHPRDPRIDAYIQKAQPFARPILEFIREAVHDACADVKETIKWGMPHFEHHGVLCGMAAHRAHCSLAFWKGSLLGIGERRSSEGMGQFGKIRSVDDLPSRARLVSLVRRSARLNEQGVKVERAKAAKPEIEVPDYFATALKKNRKAHETFTAFSPSHRREYLEWITEARQQATRDRRVATAIELLSAGKSRNWKYER